MKTIEAGREDEAVLALIAQAQGEDILLRTPDGQAYVLAEVDDFELEVERTRNNTKLMRLLNERGREKARIGLEELKRELGL